MDSGTGITGGGSEYAAILAHAGGALYGMELGSVTLKRIGFFVFQLTVTLNTHLGNSGLRGLPTRVTLFLWAFSRQGATIHNMGFCSRLGESPNT